VFRQRVTAYGCAVFAAAFFAIFIPNTSHARECICRKISSWLCIPDPPCDLKEVLELNEYWYPPDCCWGPDGSHGFEYHDERVPPGVRILETGYSLLEEIGAEEEGYGLYSYAIVNDNDRSAAFLKDVFKAIPFVEDTAALPSRTNIFYIPMKNDKKKALIEVLNKYGKNPSASTIAYARNFYDYKMSRALLDHLCDPPATEIRAVCDGDLSRGPYIFSYARPASKVTPVPPPYLFMDLSDVHERAFPEIIAAFRAQVKRDDISDRAKIDTLRLKLLSIVLTAVDFVAPVQKAMADIVHVAGGRAEGDKK
jgi:hypothetical protein